MSIPTPDITLDADLRNPGQFFACCGVLELVSRLWPGSEGWFAGEGSRAAFQVATYSSHNDPLGEIVHRLCDSEPLVELAGDHEAQPQKDRKPVLITPFGLRLDWWLDPYRGGDKSELKVWAGQQTPDGKINDLRRSWRFVIENNGGRFASHSLLSQRRPMKGRFGFDPSASWEALDVGFSPDEQDIPVQTSPATEILAAIGLQRCRPVQVEKKRRWFSFRPWLTPLEIIVVPALIAGSDGAEVGYEFPVVMRNAQYGSFGWARPLSKEEER